MQTETAVPWPPPPNRRFTLKELVIDVAEKTNPVTRLVLRDIIARRVWLGELDLIQ